jgi:hypothetical protein
MAGEDGTGEMLITRVDVAPEGSAQAREPARATLAALVLILAAVVLRAPGYTASVLDPDEGLYLTQAAAWLEGGWPFVAVWDMHPLGAPAMLLAAKALVPDPVLAMRLTGTLAVAATALGLRAIALLLGAGPMAALCAGLLYVAHSTVLGGLATNTEVLFAPWVVMAAFLLLREARSAEPPRLGAVAGAGLLVGIALLIKQVVALEASVLWLVMVASAWGAGRLSVRRLVGLAVVFAVASGLPTGVVALGYWLSGHIDAWAWGNLWAPLAYAGVEDDSPGARRAIALALPHLALLILAAFGLLAGAPQQRRMAWPVLAWLAGAVVAVAAPDKFWDHYFLILLPPLCLLAGLGLAAVVGAVVRQRRQSAAVAVLAGAIALMPMLDTLMPRVANGFGLRQPDPPRQVAALAEAALKPGQSLYVANWHTVVYVLTGQRPPTRYAFLTHLIGRHSRLNGADVDAELERVLSLPPGVIVVDPSRWAAVQPAARQRIEAAIAERYELAGTVHDGRADVEVWRLR